MTILGAFLGSGVELVEAGTCKLLLQVLTSDRTHLSGAIFTVTAQGYSGTATADSTGRAELVVPVGQNTLYTVAIRCDAQTSYSDIGYFNDEAQTVIAESATSKFVYFDLVYDEFQEGEFYTDQPASSWSADTTYEDWPYRCAIPILGVTSADFAQVVFGNSEAISGLYAPICCTYNGGVYVYSSVSDQITIPTIMIKRQTQ